MKIYTIGHSSHTEEHFVHLLTAADIQVLVDVRSNPNSRWASFANRDNLSRTLRPAQIQYVYLGDSLGGHPSDQNDYDAQTGKVDYLKIREKPDFKKALGRVLNGLAKYRICLLCAEEDPSACHRNLLVAESLRRQAVTILHIRGDGRIQTDEELWKESAGVSASQIRLPL